MNLCFPDLVIFDLHGTLLESTGDVGHFHVSDQLYDGARELLQYLQTNRVKIAMVSNSYSCYLYDEIDAADAYEYFDLICGIDTFHMPEDPYSALFKPSKTLGSNILSFFELEKETSFVWMIGDHDYDILFGVNNDFIAIGYNNEYAIENNYLNYNDYNEILADIKNI